MLTLLEPPGAKRNQAQANRSAQHLLNLAPDEEDYYDPEFDPPNEIVNEPQGSISRFLDKYLVWKSSSDEYSDRWKKEFRHRPSWCDADLCLQQIKRGKATGNKWALYSRSFIQKLLFSLGNFVQSNAATIICTVLVLFAVCCFGLKHVKIETDIVKLWVAKGGRLEGELKYQNETIEEYMRKTNLSTKENVRENGLGGGYQVIIQSPESDDSSANVLSLDGLLKHVEIMKEIASFQVEVHGSNWTLNDICFKPAPPLGNDHVAKTFEHIIERIVPCIWITPIDCFWEGGKALGPHPPVLKKDIGIIGNFLNSLPVAKEIKWTNFDPMGVIKDIHNAFPLGSHYTFFERAGIGHGYLDRPCMNPLDPECPSLAPNYFDVCPFIDRFIEFTEKNGIIVEYPAEEEDGAASIFDLFDTWGRKKRDVNDDPDATVEVHAAIPAESVSPTSSNPSVTETVPTTTTVDPIEAAKKSAALKQKHCNSKRAGMLIWMDANKGRWGEFLSASEYPVEPKFNEVMKGGCPGFASEVLHWPVDMIVGGAKRENDTLLRADALQSVFLVASPEDVYLRFKDRINMTEDEKKTYKSARDMSDWNISIAEEVIKTWQRNFTRRMYDHINNFDSDGNERRTIHPLASTSIADMLKEFCEFKYTIILVGYGLMLAYAMLTQMRLERCLPSSQSCMGLALAGVLTVTFASVAGLGLATWFGIEFNAATTQIVPFLTLGIGVDNMFMLLHNYHDVLLLTGRHEMGILMKETGMSILCTSINNILSFLAGTLLPIPALRSFCAQSCILLTFNFIAILTVYPALISIDLRRRKAGRRDFFCCLFADTREETYSMIAKPQIHQKRIIGDPSSCRDIPMSYKEMSDEPEPSPYSLHGIIRNHYIPLINKKWFRIAVGVGSALLLSLSVVGIQHASIGLELSDVLPEHTAPAKFLIARDKYFSFYPMFAVLKGGIDLPSKQHSIDNYRNEIASSNFVIKAAGGGASEKYWLQMMKDWLLSIQAGYDEAIRSGRIDTASGNISSNISEDARIAHRLVCSFGNNYECVGRVGKIRLVDGSGTINYDGFYNYLTAWYNKENMMYYVSQASFFPPPPVWEMSGNESVVPPAEPLQYSQIPFYLTNLTSTPVIIEMIKDIRNICDKFDQGGLPNFPTGIAFTFWEQYLHLNRNLIQAIGIIALAVFFVISILLFNPWAAMSILVILVAMTIELAGFLGWAGVKMNPVSAVTLITAVGIGVEFTAHVVLAYLTALGTRQERTSSAVDRVFVPVIHGAFSTLLGILMLGFSEFEFVVKYFFVVMSALIVIGVINGLILLPVLLSLAGPPQEVSPVDPPPTGRIRLALPPPIRRRRPRDIETDDEDDSPGLIMRRQI